MGRDKEIDRAIGQYLERVAAEMGNVPADEKDSVLREVESHVYAALENRAGAGATLEDLQVVLAEMAPPASYGEQSPSQRPIEPPRAPAVRRRLCWVSAVGAALCLPAMLFILVAGTTALAMWLPAAGRANAGSGSFLSLECIGILIVLGVVPTSLGVVGISRIRASRGELYGMPLAVTAALIYPLIAFTAVAFFMDVMMTRMIKDALTQSGGTSAMAGLKIAFVALILLILGLDVLIVRRVWRWANRPVKEGEFT
jgi:hypothetical protein